MNNLPASTTSPSSNALLEEPTSIVSSAEIAREPEKREPLLDELKSLLKESQALNKRLDRMGQEVQEHAQEVKEVSEGAKKNAAEIAELDATFAKLETDWEVTKQVFGAALVAATVVAVAGVTAPPDSHRLPHRRAGPGPGPRRTHGRQ